MGAFTWSGRAGQGNGSSCAGPRLAARLSSPPARRGFGTRVMENVIGQMEGDIRFDWRAEGLACEIAV
jgi:hypothetical protein